MEIISNVMTGGIFIIFVYFLEVIINFAVWVFIIKIITNCIKTKNNRRYFKNNVVINSKTESNEKYNREYIDISKTKLAEFNIDNIDELKDYFYNIFLNFETAYNNLDYNMMKILSTKQMYQNYYVGMTLDLKSGQKKIINDIEKKKVVIFELDSTIAKQIASVMIEISYISYTIDKKGYVISGSRDNKITEKFEVMFRKDFERENVIKCPNCGADVVGNKCDFCRSTIKNVEFKISSIRKIVYK